MSNQLSVIDDIVDRSAEQFVSTLTQYQWNLIPDSQLQAAKQALTKNDYIEKIACQDPKAVHDALINSAVLGLDLTEGKRQGWLLPRKNQKGKTVIVLQTGYKGVEAIHQRIGVIDRLSIRVVRKEDTFEWTGDDQEKPVHTADWLASDEDRGQATGAFAITYYPDGTFGVTVTSIETIYTKHRDRSEAWKGYQKKIKEGKYAYPPPWVSDEKSMIEKTMAYIASKQWPANIRDNEVASKILQTLHEVDTSDYSLGYTTEQKEAFNNFIEHGDGLGFELFQNYVGMDVYMRLALDLRGSIPRGQKDKEMGAMQDKMGDGNAIFLAIKQAIADEDVGGLLENMEGTLDVTKSLLIKRLDPEETEIFNNLMEGTI